MLIFLFIQSVLCIESIRSILEKPEFDFSLLTRKAFNSTEDIGVLLSSDIDHLIHSLVTDFPDILSLSSIGPSFEGRNISLLTLDARHHFVSSQYARGLQGRKGVNLTQIVDNELLQHWHQQPGILLTGQIHPREMITASMVMYSLLKLLHGALNNDLKAKKLLEQNKYYFMPIVNVDGAKLIEE